MRLRTLYIVTIASLSLAACGGQSRQEKEDAAVAASEAAQPAPAVKVAEETMCDNGWLATVSIYRGADGTEMPSGIRRADPGVDCNPANFKKTRTPTGPGA